MDREITLLTAARKMNQDALREIFELYAPVLYKYALRLCNDALMADELVEEVFNRFVEQLAAGQNPGVNLRACLYEIAYNFIVGDHRYTNCFLSTNRPRLAQRDLIGAQLDGQDQMLVNAIQWAIIHDLTQDQRHVVLLRFTEGFSLKETAAIIGKKVNHVKVIQNRGIGALRRSINHSAAETHTITFCLRRLGEPQVPNLLKSA